MVEDAPLELDELRARVRPRALQRCPRTSWNARSASPCRPARYAASIRWAHSRSSRGCCSVSASSSLSAVRWSPTPGACRCAIRPCPSTAARAGRRSATAHGHENSSSGVPDQISNARLAPHELLRRIPFVRGARAARLFEAVRIERSFGQVQHVAGRSRRQRDAIGTGEELAQLRHVGLHGQPGRRRRPRPTARSRSGPSRSPVRVARGAAPAVPGA